METFWRKLLKDADFSGQSCSTLHLIGHQYLCPKKEDLHQTVSQINREYLQFALGRQGFLRFPGHISVLLSAITAVRVFRIEASERNCMLCKNVQKYLKYFFAMAGSNNVSTYDLHA